MNAEEFRIGLFNALDSTDEYAEDGALDFIYGTWDEYHRNQQYDLMMEIMETLDVYRVPLSCLLGILTTSAWSKDYLGAVRTRFYKKVESLVEPSEREATLVGLE